MMCVRVWLASLMLVMGCGGGGGKEDCEASEKVPTYEDQDGDGFGVAGSLEETCGVPQGRTNRSGDCDDTVAEAFPGNPEVCDGIDNDCNGQADDDMGVVPVYADNDGDGFGDPNDVIETCLDLSGYVLSSDDCDDGNGDINPDGDEVCDNVDNDCNGLIDDDDSGLDRTTATTWHPDVDGDGYGDADSSVQRCLQPSGTVTDGSDCDDLDEEVHPGALEICNGGVDDNCDGLADDADPAVDPGLQAVFYADTDGDSYGDPLNSVNACVAPIGFDPDGTDCDDTSNQVYPGAPETVANGVDEDCDGFETCLEDLDGDDYGATVLLDSADLSCSLPGLAALGGDCDDLEPSAYPGAVEIVADGVDQNCDFVDDCYEDFDGDGYGGAAIIAGDDLDCATGPGESPLNTDCDDGDNAHWSDCGLCGDLDGDGHGALCDLGEDCDESDATVYFGATEVPADGSDSNCDGFEACFPDADGDTFGSGALVDSSDLTCTSPGLATVDGDCDDGDPDAFPGAPALVGDGVDQDCDGFEECYQDLDGDGIGGAVEIVGDDLDCTNGVGESDLGTDCDDGSDAHWSDCGLCVDLDGDDLGDQCDLGPDCDDTQAAHWDDCGLCVDGDADDYGLDCNLGDDCDDMDAAVNPGVPEIDNDGIDQDCDGVDGGLELFDDFELGVADPEVWALQVGDAVVGPGFAASGTQALAMGGAVGTMETVVLDTSGCASLFWSYQVKRGPETPDTGDGVTLSYDDGGGWVVADFLEGNGSDDIDFSLHWGIIDDAAALGPDFRMQLVSNGSGPGFDVFFIDDFWVTCGEDDSDGDGRPGLVDCDDTDPDHWADCGICVDDDGDGFGEGCDLGGDCDDLDPLFNPLALDLPGNGIDENCSNVDGPGLYDGFEEGAPAGGLWSHLSGDYEVTNTYAAVGTYSLNMGGGGATLETFPMRASSCVTLLWAYEGKRGPESPDADDGLNLEYHDGVSWVVADRWTGDGSTDVGFTQRLGVILDPLAFHDDLRLRLVSQGSGGDFDDFFIDEFTVACDEVDGDGDGFPDFIDCDPADPAHWLDCGICTDFDGDGFGLGCDLGMDCDDVDAAIHPMAADLVVDGVDENCDGVDGPALFVDDLDSGVLDPGLWPVVLGDAGLDSTYVWSPSFSLRLGGLGGTVETAPVDTTACAAVAWSFMGKRGPEVPDIGDDVSLSFWNGAAWVGADVWAGTGLVDVDFGQVSGVIVDPLALSASFQLRMESVGSGLNLDQFYIDDLAIGCAP